ncbi:MAG: tRNA dihydrouridine synthase DusB [Clostridiales bacterium]|nr:tRNA dihydrouridine synthase DusB [Clostridiales bacterium]
MDKLIVGAAPMAGLSDRVMRALCYRMGANYACTEMISAVGWMYAKDDNPVYQRLLSLAPEETNTAIQLFGKDPKVLEEAAARATEMRCFASVDINMGCPARKVTSTGEGSALLKRPDIAVRVMEAVKAGTALPVTVKMRLGYDDDTLNACALAKAAEDIGLRWVCIHGRTREQMFAGRADLYAVAEIKRKVSIPVLFNGDIFTAEDAISALKETGCDGILIGRGAMGNPWLFREISDAIHGKEIRKPDNAERLATIEEHIDRLAAFKGERIAMLQMRTHIGHYIRGLPGAAEIRRRLHAVTTTLGQKELLRTVLQPAQKPRSAVSASGSQGASLTNE